MRTLLITVSILLLSLGGLNFYFQSLDLKPQPHYDLPQTELPQNEPINAIDAVTGKLSAKGWTRTPNKIFYNPNMSKVYWPILSRNKQWNYFYVVNEDYLVTMAHANVGVIKSAYVNILDLKNPGKMVETVIEDYFHNYVFIDVIKNGNGIYSTVDHPDLTMKFIKPHDEKNVDIFIKSVKDTQTIEGHFVGDMHQSEGLSVLEDQTADGLFHAFNSKTMVELQGSLKIDGLTIMDCSEKKWLGLHDNGRSIGKYMNTWVWGTSVFRTEASKDKKSHKIGINISLSEKEQTASGDALFIDDKLYKLDPFVITKESDDVWTLESFKGKSAKYLKNEVNLKFKINDRHKIYKNMILVEINFNSNFGHFSGSIKTEDGHNITFADQFGFIEEMFSRW